MNGRRDKEFVTKFYERKDIGSDSDSKNIEPMKFLNNHCMAKVTIRIESIFIVKTITLQV